MLGDCLARTSPALVGRSVRTYCSVGAQMVSWPHGLGTVLMSERPLMNWELGTGNWELGTGNCAVISQSHAQAQAQPLAQILHRLPRGRVTRAQTLAAADGPHWPVYPLWPRRFCPPTGPR